MRHLRETHVRRFILRVLMVYAGAAELAATAAPGWLFNRVSSFCVPFLVYGFLQLGYWGEEHKDR